VQNLVSVVKGGTETEGVSEQGAEEHIQTKEWWHDRSGDSCIMSEIITCTTHSKKKIHDY
jgi:hypothetical protein